MKLFTHRSFSNGSGSIVVMNGQEVVTMTLEQFQEAEPSYALPLQHIQREYSPGLRHDLISTDGQVKLGQMPWSLGDKIIENIATYKKIVENQELNVEVVEETNSLEGLKERCIQLLSNTCNDMILGGFTSGALGETYHYDGSLESQTNLLGALALARQTSAPVPLTCTQLQTGSKQPRPHTLKQLEQVFQDGCAFKTSKIAKYHELKAKVLAATTSLAISGITWDSEP